MTSSVDHRGPDFSSYWISENIGLGHTRLSIIDLSENANQPFSSPCGRWRITYNGEIYNYRELRKVLEHKGYQFLSESDTEVLLWSVVEWGSDALPLLNGMFAFFFVDLRERAYLFARDRYGIKPLYYAKVGDLLAVGSEPKAIATLPDFRPKVDLSALCEYLTFQNVLSQRTLLDGVSPLPPGSFAFGDFGSDGDVSLPMRYWDFEFVSTPTARSDRELSQWSGDLRDLLRQAVERQLVSDVEIGAFLSGGLDSSAIATFAAHQVKDLKTFTCGFDLTSASGRELHFDERAVAEATSAALGTEHYEVVLKAGDMEKSLSSVSWYLDDPRVGQSYPNLYVSKLASRFVKVVLAGTGGDELFGGYPWRYFRSSEKMSFDSFVDQYYLQWQRLLSNTELRQLLTPIRRETNDIWTRDIFASVFGAQVKRLNEPRDFVNWSMYFEAKTFLPGLLTVEDRLSMAHGLESRVPFLDNDLVDFAMRCPVELKLRDLGPVPFRDENLPGRKADSYSLGVGDGKIVLRRALESVVPPAVLLQKKQGFSSPDESWFRRESRDFALAVTEPGEPLWQYLDRNVATNLIREHQSGVRNRRLLVWSLLNLNSWLKHFVP